MIGQEATIVVGMGEMQVTNDPYAVLACLGLGSCICVCVYEPTSKLGGMAHIVLPKSDMKDGVPTPKYADTGIPLLPQSRLLHLS